MVRDRREVRAAGLGIALVALYLAMVLASGRVDPVQFAALWRGYLAGSFALWFILAFAGIFWLLFRNRPVNGIAPSPIGLMVRWAMERWARDRLASLLWPPVMFATLMAAFNAYKQMVLPAAGFRFDPLFASLDRALFLGTDPWRVSHALFASPRATWIIDQAYHGWFVPMALGLVACAWLPRASYRLRTQYMLSYAFVWIGIGSVLAFLLPAAGPCFYTHFVGPAPGFQALLETLASDQAAVGAPLAALSNQAGLLGGFGSDRLMIGGGISAMPSVHNALAALFAFAAWRINRWAGVALTAYAALIWIGSIHLGWHYAIDGIVSIVLAWGIWIGCGRIADRLDRPAFRPAPAAAFA